MLSKPLWALILGVSLLGTSTILLPWARVKYADPTSRPEEQEWWVLGFGETNRSGGIVIDPVGWRGILAGSFFFGSAAMAVAFGRHRPRRVAMASIAAGAIAVVVAIAYIKGVDFGSPPTDPVSVALSNRLRELFTVNRMCVGPFAVLALGLTLSLVGIAALRGKPPQSPAPD